DHRRGRRVPLRPHPAARLLRRRSRARHSVAEKPMTRTTALPQSERHPSVLTLPSLGAFRTAAEASAIAALLFLPFLGSVGLRVHPAGPAAARPHALAPRGPAG